MKKGIKILALSAIGLLIVRTVARRLNDYNLKNKIVLITGGSRGLGLILARLLNKERARLVVCARDKAELEEVSGEFSQHGSQIFTIPCDITDKKQVDAMLDQVRQKMGRIDVVINNASIIQVAPEQNMTEEDYRKALDVHFWGPLHINSRVLPGMIKRKSGRIVNIISIGGKLSFPHLLPYNVSKFALSGYSEGLAAQMARYNIKITSVYPGLMRTGSHRNILVKGQKEKEYKWFAALANMPGVSMNAEKAARRIITGLKRGNKVLILSAMAKLGNVSHALFPGLVLNVFSLINRFLPAYPGNGGSVKKGSETTNDIPFRRRATKVGFKFNQA
jgi:short-subunit dehydrogenase